MPVKIKTIPVTQQWAEHLSWKWSDITRGEIKEFLDFLNRHPRGKIAFRRTPLDLLKVKSPKFRCLMANLNLHLSPVIHISFSKRMSIKGVDLESALTASPAFHIMTNHVHRIPVFVGAGSKPAPYYPAPYYTPGILFRGGSLYSPPFHIQSFPRSFVGGNLVFAPHPPAGEHKVHPYIPKPFIGTNFLKGVDLESASTASPAFHIMTNHVHRIPVFVGAGSKPAPYYPALYYTPGILFRGGSLYSAPFHIQSFPKSFVGANLVFAPHPPAGEHKVHPYIPSLGAFIGAPGIPVNSSNTLKGTPLIVTLDSPGSSNRYHHSSFNPQHSTSRPLAAGGIKSTVFAASPSSIFSRGYTYTYEGNRLIGNIYQRVSAFFSILRNSTVLLPQKGEHFPGRKPVESLIHIQSPGKFIPGFHGARSDANRRPYPPQYAAVVSLPLEMVIKKDKKIEQIDIEEVEKNLNQKVAQQVQQTLRQWLDRRLAAGSGYTQQLIEDIYSQLLNRIVLEKERVI